MKRLTILLLLACISIGVMPSVSGANDDYNENYEVVVEEGLILRRIAYYYLEGGRETESIPGVFGIVSLSYMVYGPSNACWTNASDLIDYEPDEQEISEIIEKGIEERKDHPYVGKPAPLPFLSGIGTRLIREDDFGRTKYVLIYGLDEEMNAVGYAVVKILITRSDGDIIMVKPYDTVDTSFTEQQPATSTNRSLCNYMKRSSRITSYLHWDGEFYTRVEMINKTVIIEKYSSDFKYISSKTLDLKNDSRKESTSTGEQYNGDHNWQWGGLYFGKGNYYVLLGWMNIEENPSLETFRIIKYDKDFNYISETSIYNSNTTVPSTNARFAEDGDYLYAHTDHTMYMSDDGLSHQASMLIRIDTTEPVTLNKEGRYTSWHHMQAEVCAHGYVSHSFNQFIIIDNDHNLILLNHGDAHPRSIYLQRFTVDNVTGLYESSGSVDIQLFPGAIGDNTTGASLGGIAETRDAYITAYNYNGIGANSSGVVMGVSSEDPNPIRNIYISLTLKAAVSNSGTTAEKITDYPENGELLAGTPFVAPVGLSGGYVIWEVLELDESGYYSSTGKISYVKYTANGSISPIETVDGMLSDCQPITVGDKVVWYVTDDSAPVFYILGNDGLTQAQTGGSPFTDVDKDEYYYDAVVWALKRGITNGTSQDTFSPYKTVTRGEAVTFLWRAMGSPAPVSDHNPFIDVDQSSYYYNAVLWAVEQGITNGTSETTFSPSANLTRGHMITFLWRSLGRPNNTGGEWYEAAENWATSKGFLAGTSSTYTRQGECPRCDVATYMYRALQ